MFNAMFKERFPNRTIVTKLISDGGMTLEGHFKNEETLNTIKSEQWDYVVLQEQHHLGGTVFINNARYMSNGEYFYPHARKFDKIIKESGAKTVFLLTWSDKQRPKEQAYYSYVFSNITKELNSILIPVGLVWNIERTHTDYDLYNEDGYHPSEYGSYLLASTVFSTLFKTNPEGITGELDGYTVNHEGSKSFFKSTLSSLTQKQANAIHSSVWQVIKNRPKSGGYPIGSKPNLSYTIPTLPIGNMISENDLHGTWQGLSKFDFISDGLQITFSKLSQKLNATIHILRDDEALKTTIVDMKLSEKDLIIHFKDEDGRIREITIVKIGEHLEGIIISTKGNHIKYDTINLIKH